MNIQQQTRFLSDRTLRELVDSIGKDVLIVDNTGEIFIGVLSLVHANTKNEIQGITVKAGKESTVWRTQWKNAVLV